MTKPGIHSLCLLLLTTMVFMSCNRETRPPNILLTIADDWSWPHAGIAGTEEIHTPAFDRVASEGVLFTHAFCSSPSCTPSRGALLTGQYHWRLENNANLFRVSIKMCSFRIPYTIRSVNVLTL